MQFRFSSLIGKAAAAAGLLLAALGTAHARDNVYWSVGVHASPSVTVGVSNARPVVVHPQPVYVQPAPVYVTPAPVYVTPPPSYIVPPVVYTPPPVVYPRPIYYAQPAYALGHGHHKHHHHHHHWKGRHGPGPGHHWR